LNINLLECQMKKRPIYICLLTLALVLSSKSILGRYDAVPPDMDPAKDQNQQLTIEEKRARQMK